ncbi:MAG: sulfatase family protein [Planctomycetota bacterium]
MSRKPNVVFVFGDEWRMQATGFNGDPNCETPVLDGLAAQSVNITHAVSGAPVCSPYRASLLTGQYPLAHGVYINDVELDPNCQSVARAFKAGGYDTAYVGKWHVYGSPDGQYGRRSAYVPREHQLGFDYWKGFECTHDYNDSVYFVNDDPTPRKWEGYDALAQSHDAAAYIKGHADTDNPFLLMLSWGPPHFPLDSAPKQYRERYADREIELRPNVPPEMRDVAAAELRGYYAHIAALDDCMKVVLDAIDAAGLADDTIVVFTSDHGDMRGSQGLHTKLFPWDESIRVPFLLRWPALQKDGCELPVPLDAPDIMPTLLGLCDLVIPETVEGRDFSPLIRGDQTPTGDEAALLVMPAAFHELRLNGMKPYRGLRTMRYTYVRNTDGPWLLYDNQADPYQMSNLISRDSHAAIQTDLERQLQQRLDALGDEFLDGQTYLERDGLDHYYEANDNCVNQWSDPWA